MQTDARLSWQKIAALAVLGFASGLPLYLTGDILQAWMRVEKVDLTTIGTFSLVALPYSFKPLWAPVVDRFAPPFLGRRRGWLIVTQIGLIVAIAAMATQDPRRGLQAIAVVAVVIAFFSASQDLVADAYRTDVLSDREMGAGAAVWVLGYRIALIVTGALAFALADRMSWQMVYIVMAVMMGLGVVGTLMAPEPAPHGVPPTSLWAAIALPFREFTSRRGVGVALGVLAFIVIYKLPDALAAKMATPFLVDTGFSLTEIGAIRGGLGIAATIAGAIAGGVVATRAGINKSLWLFCLLQAVSNLGYYALAISEKSNAMLVAAMCVENFCSGLVSAGFVAYLMTLCAHEFSAMQYALLSALLGVSRDIIGSRSGAMAEGLGWPGYFLMTIVIALPGLALLPLMVPWRGERPTMAVPHSGETAATPP
jgi:PAT family beta-lactamase induction signal transducer AmpG